MMDKKIIKFYEPIVFIFFGLLHLHRIWGLIDRKSYADFWLSLMVEKNLLYYALMGSMAILCLIGVINFFLNCNIKLDSLQNAHKLLK